MTAANNLQNNGNNHNNEEIPIKNELNDVEKEDVAKLHNEVNQLRNHELLVNSFAIAMVVVVLPALKESITLSIVILIMLTAMHYWQYTLLDIRTRITTYLTSNKLSRWEKNYRVFSNEYGGPSMRKTSALLFIVLGLVTVVAPFSSTFSLSKIGWTSLSTISFIIYSFVIFFFGFILFFLNKMLESIKNKKWITFRECGNNCLKECQEVSNSISNMPAYIQHIIIKYTCKWCEIRLTGNQVSSTAPVSVPPPAPPPAPR